MQNKAISPYKVLNIRGRLVDLEQLRIMGIINVTPDSFYAGSRQTHISDWLKQAENMLTQGATFLDIGGYSSRPGAEDVPEAEEWRRVGPAIETIRKHFPEALLSIDTFRARIAHHAVQEGADMVNDIRAGEGDERMFETIASLRIPYVIMHMRGTPQTMTTLTEYTDVTREVIDYFYPKIYQLTQSGVKDIILDPGFGFAKTPAQGFQLLRQLDALHVLSKPVMVGLSRKSMIWKTLQTSAPEALNGTTVLNTIALIKGASILRVHDVAEARECISLVQALEGK
jgi:dihydropteroate synthase